MTKLNKLNNIMVDIETVDNTVTSAILSIAAVPWNPSSGSYARKNFFYEVVNLQSCFDKGLTAGGATLEWWFKQSEDARLAAFGYGPTPDLARKPLNLNDVLIKFSNFLQLSEFTKNELRLWGNSARFDLGIIANAYKACNIPIPWSYRTERDVRTLVEMGPSFKKQTRTVGTKHNPVDDCIYQIKYCSKIWRNINNGKNKKGTKKETSSKAVQRKKI